MEYLLIQSGSEQEYKARISEQEATDPVEVLEPENTFVLPVTVLEIEGITGILPDIESLPRIDESEITWMVYEDDI